MHAFLAVLLAVHAGAPLWAWLSLGAVLTFEDVIARSSLKSNSTFQLLGSLAALAQRTLVGRFPGLAQLLRLLGGLAPLLVFLACASAGCATVSTPGDATLERKVQDDAAALKSVVADVKAKCGPQYASLAPVWKSLEDVIADPTNVLADFMAALTDLPIVIKDADALACVYKTTSTDLRALFPKKSATINDWERRLPVRALAVSAPLPACDSTGDHVDGACRLITCDSDDVDCADRPRSIVAPVRYATYHRLHPRPNTPLRRIRL